jgi:hypothetical protein
LHDWLALGLVVLALFTVLFQPSARKPTAVAPIAPDD